MKKEFKLGYLDWILNKQRYINLYFEKQDKVQELILQNQELKNDLTSATSEFLTKDEKNNSIIEDLQKRLIEKTNRVLVLEKAVGDRNNEIEELHYELSKLNLKIDSLEKKVERRDNTINNLRDERKEKDKKIVSISKELAVANNKIKLLEQRIPKPKLEELKAYSYGRKAILKKSKESKKTNESI